MSSTRYLGRKVRRGQGFHEIVIRGDYHSFTMAELIKARRRYNKQMQREVSLKRRAKRVKKKKRKK